jgi:endonuclease-3 related protein
MKSLKILYDGLLDHFGQQHWWPVDKGYHKNQGSDPRFEIIIGAILTQNTAWINVEKALENLKEKKALTICKITDADEASLKRMIQPSGFFNQKAIRLKLFASYIHKNYHDDLQRFFSRETSEIRHELLMLKGIGPETADSILLYAGNHPVFVIDAYTKRICTRFPFQTAGDSYDTLQHFFDHELQRSIPKEQRVPVYKEFHALLVVLAKNYCLKKKPHCDACPVTDLCKKAL